MYNNIKETQKQSEKFNNESQKVIDELENDIKYIKVEREHLQKANIQHTEDRNKAVKDY